MTNIRPNPPFEQDSLGVGTKEAPHLPVRIARETTDREGVPVLQCRCDGGRSLSPGAKEIHAFLERNVYRPYSTYTSAQDDRYEAANAPWPTGPAKNNPSTFVWLYRRGLCDVIDIERKTKYWNNATLCGYWESDPYEGRKDLEKSLDAFVNLRATFTLTERAKRLRSWLERRYPTPRVGVYVDNFVWNGTRFEREEYALREKWHFFHLARSYEIPIGEVMLERRKRS